MDKRKLYQETWPNKNLLDHVTPETKTYQNVQAVVNIRKVMKQIMKKDLIKRTRRYNGQGKGMKWILTIYMYVP